MNKEEQHLNKDDEKLKYLPKDQDLLDELYSIGEMSTGLALSKQQMKASEIHIKATLRNRKTMVDLDKSNKKFTIVIGVFALVQIFIAGLQFVLEVAIFPKKLLAIFVSVVFIAGIFWVFKLVDKTIKQ